ncbi:SulP family inorganic anion transporter [Burkholderia cenocepacia]|uniref:SulP family inorganic anion transporter n=1 Tax=Burkholderia cenocepacia TaxID=95486 RepID=A0A3Q9FDH3_9BURK|nr:SulP family inorganic anion transporter [Burkholderia cenocepacia]AZQ55664.1 SulP family inorganic anion transporter [Burkholderia cenocepacia]
MNRKSRTRPHTAPPARQPAGGPLQWINGITVARGYQLPWLPHDLLAGVTLSAVLVPAGMAYAQAAGLPAVNGLYASFAAMLAYALFGPSRILVLGPDSALVALIAASIMPLARGDATHALALAGALAILTGAICIAVGALRLGFVTELLSLPIRYGFLNGIMLTIGIGQLPRLLGYKGNGESFVEQVRDVVEGISASKVNATSLALGVAALVLILACKRLWPKAPGVLLAVAGATVAVMWFDLSRRAGVATVGAIAQGLPVPRFPHVALGDWLHLAGSAAAIALVSFTDISVLSRTYEVRNDTRVDRNHECVALGLSNIAAGLVQGFAVSASGSRTPVAEAAGAKTQATGVVAAAVVAALLLFAPRALAHTPQSALAAVVIAACLNMVEVRGVVRLYRLRKSEFVQAVVCFVGVAVLGVVNGIALALLLTVLSFLWRAWRPYDAVLGRVDGRKGYHDVSRHPEARRVPGLVLLRWDAPLFFANGEIFRERVLRAVDESPEPARWIVIAAEPVTDIDLTAADVLERLHRELAARQVKLVFAELKGPVKDSLKHYGMYSMFGDSYLFPTIGEAVSRYVETHQIKWRDWEDARR